MKRAFAALLTLASLACATAPAPAPPPAPAPAPAPAQAAQCRPGDAILNASLWIQSAAEYRAAAIGTYAAARRSLDAALADPSWSALGQTSASSLPPAIILDGDETSIDNVRFESRAVHMGKTYDAALWKQWVSESAAGPTPGAPEFLAYAKSRGVTPFWITNRRADEEAPTRRNLEKLGYPLDPNVDVLLVRGERPEWSSGDKTARREWVASQYRVLLVLGDDLNDFVNAREKSQAERETLLARTLPHWGIRWFMLPNPVYGSWEDAVVHTSGLDDCTVLQKKREALRE